MDLMHAANSYWSALQIATQRFLQDDMTTSTVLWSICYIILTLVAVSICRSGRREADLPPGPPTIPFLGNIHRLSSPDRLIDYKWYQEMAAKYGPIMSIIRGRLTAIIISDDGAAFRELFEKRAEYNNRPANTVASLVGRDMHPIYQQDTSDWRFNRKLLVQHFNSSMACRSSQIKIQEAESTQLLKDLIESTTATTPYAEHFARFAWSVISSTTYGIRLPTCDHPLPKRYWQPLSAWVKMNIIKEGGAPPVDNWPWLDYLIPSFIWPWKQKCRKISDELFRLYREVAEMSRTLDAQGIIDDTLAHKLFSVQTTQPKLTDTKISLVLGVAIEGGGEIVAGVLGASLLALLTHPDVQTKGRAEVDRLCDEDTIPSWVSVEKMQYIRSIGKESLRWRPPFPMGVPHATTKDDEYMGYKLPGHSTVAMNIWAIHMNPARYEDPESFKPERFQNHTLATGDYMSIADHSARDHFAFAPGRRTCPGAYMAEQAQMLIIAKLLWAFDIAPPPGTSISEIDNSYHTAFRGAALRSPKPFQVVLKPRNERRVQVILADFNHLSNVFFPSFEHDFHFEGL